MNCVRHLGVNDTLCWWDKDDCVSGWTCALISKIAGLDDEADYWLLDNSMQLDFARCHYGADDVYYRPLAHDFIRALTEESGLTENCYLCDFRRRQLNKALPDYNERFSSFGWTHLLAQRCHVCTAGDMVCRFFPGGDPGPGYNLPALLFALRLLSPMNAQTVTRQVQLCIPHRYVHATISLSVGFDDYGNFSIGEEESSLSIGTCYRRGYYVDGSLAYYGTAAEYASALVYYRYNDRQPPSATCEVYPEPTVDCYGNEQQGNPEIVSNPAFYCFDVGCWVEWGIYVTGGQSTVGPPAQVILQATWPDLSAQANLAFGGKAYPARWAVREGDVAFGAVSAIVSNGAQTKKKFAWVVNATTQACQTLGNKDDLMKVLGEGILRAAARRYMADADLTNFKGNTFCGVDFPVTWEALRQEMVGSQHDQNLRVLRRLAALTPKQTTSHRFSMLRICFDPGRCLSRDRPDRVWGIRQPGDNCSYWEPLAWMQYNGDDYLYLANRGAVGVSFSYQRDYNGLEGDCYWSDDPEAERAFICQATENADDCARVGWRASPASTAGVQFGGFFGTFIFRNRASHLCDWEPS